VAESISQAERQAAAGKGATAGLAAVGEAISTYRGGRQFTTDDQLARLVVTLDDIRVRDDAWGARKLSGIASEGRGLPV
jgi:hypothetical protein